MRITSSRNPLVRYVRSLERGQVRRSERAYLAEGVRLVSEALETGQPATLALYDPSILAGSEAGARLASQLPNWADRSYEVDYRIVAAASQTETPQGVVVVLALPDEPRLPPAGSGEYFGVVLDGIGDPGNAGTILRTAAAAGVDFVAALEGTVDLFSPKVVRAGMGAHFRLPLRSGVDSSSLRETFPGAKIVALEGAAETSIYYFDWSGSVLLVVGSEAHGLSPAVQAAAPQTVRIPMRAGVESLNAAIAAAIAIYSALGPNISREDERYK